VHKQPTPTKTQTVSFLFRAFSRGCGLMVTGEKSDRIFGIPDMTFSFLPFFPLSLSFITRAARRRLLYKRRICPREKEDTAIKRERASTKRNANSSASFSSPSLVKKRTRTFQVTLGQVTDRLLRGLDSQRAHDFLRLSLGRRHRLRGNVRAERDGLLSGKSRHCCVRDLFCVCLCLVTLFGCACKVTIYG
jgi:hypothetical protein